jgi:hypothetical protein
MRLLVAILCGLALLCGSARAQLTPQIIYVVNESSVPTYRIADALPAFQQAADEDFGPVWNAYGQLQLTTLPPEGAWEIDIVDTPDIWASGYHTMHGRVPYGQVGTKTGIPWQLVFSHELFEMLADPYVDRASYVPPLCIGNTCHSGEFYAVEVSDPVEALRYAYWKKSPYGRHILISDFVTPNWFTGQGGAALDFTGNLLHHHQIGKGGYVYICREGNWQPLGTDEFRRR